MNENRELQNYSNRARELARRDPFFSPLVDLFDLPEIYSRESNVLKTDIKENDENYFLEVEVPGIKKDDVKLSVKNGYLVINAKYERKNEEKEKNRFVRTEREYGNFSRSFYVGDNIITSDVKARMEDGILYVLVPKHTDRTEKEGFVAID